MNRSLWIAIVCLMCGLAGGFLLRPATRLAPSVSAKIDDHDTLPAVATYPSAATLQSVVAVIDPDFKPQLSDATGADVTIAPIMDAHKPAVTPMTSTTRPQSQAANHNPPRPTPAESSAGLSAPLVIEVPTYAAARYKDVRIPAALAFNAYDEEMTFEQMDGLDAMVDDFIAEINYGDDPEDPAYARRWEASASDLDAKFRLHYGDRAYVRMNLRAAQEANAGAY